MITKFTGRRVRACSVLMLGMAATPAWAQNNQTPAPTLIPGLENYSLPPGPGTRATRPAAPPPVVRTVPFPGPTPTPSRTPTPASSTAPPRAIPTQPAPTRPVATPSLQPQAIPALPPVSAPTPTPVPTPAETPSAEITPPVVAPTVEPLPTAPAPTPEPVMDHGFRLDGWPAIAAIGGGAGTLFLLGWLIFLYLRRRAEVHDEGAPERQAHVTFDLQATDTPPVLTTRSEPPPPPPPPAPAPLSSIPASPPPSATASSTRATLDIEFRPKRAGTNLLSAAVEYEILVTNSGDAPARGVAADVRILSAGAEQDGIIRALFASPIEKSGIAPFEVPPGETAILGGMAMMPKETLSVMTIEGRALFVPVLAVNLLYGWEGGSGQTATSYVIGIDRGEGAKLAPFRVDGTSRMRDDISQIPYTVSVRR